MKKTLLFACTVLLVFASGFFHRIQAQTWTAPALMFSDLASGTPYYVYNVGSNAYLSRGGSYNTEAAVRALPKLDASTVTKWTAVNTVGSTWTFQYNSNGSDVSGNYLFAPGTDGSTYTDNSTNNTWDVVLTDAPTKTYSIQIVSTNGGYNATQYLGSALDPVWSVWTVPYNTVRYNRASGDNYTQWKFASQADMDLYTAKVLLDRYMNYAKKRGGIDITSYITTYNAGVTADINTDAANLLTALGRTDVTSSITNPSFETAAQAGWTNSGGFANQNNTSFCKKDGGNYTEKWGGSSFLPTGTITQTISGLSNGIYGLVASGLAEAGVHSGAFFKAGTDSTEISSCDDYNVDYAIVTDGTLKIGLALSGKIGCHWVTFDNFRLYYYGAIVTPTLTLSASSLTYVVPGTKKVAVTGLNLSTVISITAPANFSVSPAMLPAAAAGDSVAITYDGGAAASGYVVFTSGSTKDSVQVTGTAIPSLVPSVTGLILNDIMFKDSITVTGINLTSDITITAPAGITVNPTTIPQASAAGVKVHVNYDGSTAVNDSIVFTAGALVKKVGIKAISSAGCFTPLYASGNLVADPTFSAASLSSGGYYGWGSTSASTGPDSVYCGVKSGKVTGKCGGSIDVHFSSALKSNTVYRLKAAVLTIGGSFKIGMNGIGTGVANYIARFNTDGKWKIIDTTVVTGNNSSCSVMFFNSCEAETGTVGYIDNWEFYPLPIQLSSTSLTFLGSGIKKVAVTGINLTNNISITAPTGFSVTPNILFSTVAGDSVAITYNNSADVSGYVVFKSGSVKDSVQVTGTALSTDATLSSLTISDGTLTPVFAAGTTNYSVEVPVGTVVVPTITTAATTETHATPVITQATSTPGTATVVVTAQDGTTKKTYTVNFTLGAPAAPVAADATTVAKKSFSANWAASTGTTGYFLDVATDNAFTAFVIGYNNLNVGNVTTYPVTDLVAATTYYYRVRATNGKVSDNSNVISVLSLGTGVQSLASNGLGISVTANAVELESNNAILSVQVVNVNGTLMTEKSINATKATIGTEGWASGIYVFTVKTQSQVVTTKLGIVK